MEITDIRIRKVDAEGKMRAVVSVTFDNEFVIHDIKIIESQSGMFITMPSPKPRLVNFRYSTSYQHDARQKFKCHIGEVSINVGRRRKPQALSNE